MNLPAILVVAPAQRDRALRLIEHCRNLDGTKLTVIEGGKGTLAPYPACTTNAFHQAAAALRGQPFLWLEPDSIPLRAGWKAAIEREYERAGKPILAPHLSENHFDKACGIAVYPGEAHWLIPKVFQFGAWDLWMENHLAPLIARTNLIFHSYGHYTPEGKAREHQFPADRGIIPDEAVIFHRDKAQELIPSPTPRGHRFAHSGDLGDVIAALPAIRALGGGDIVLTDYPSGCRESLRGARFAALRPLLAAQPYVGKVEWQDTPTGITHDFTRFRFYAHEPHENLAIWQARAVDADIHFGPWLTTAAPMHGRPVIARSSRYHNQFFPWTMLLRRFPNALFVGLESEHRDFENKFRVKVEYAPTEDLLALARVIAGASICIMNQSAPFWIAAGLGVSLIQESWELHSNSVIPRPNALYTTTGPDTRTLIYRLDEIL